jgi:hypothetical protein
VIVRRDAEDLVLVRQADHALLSGWLAAAWGAAPWQSPEPHRSTVVGARLHDLAWTPFDEELHCRPDGQPVAFIEVDRSTSTGFYAGGLDAVEAIDPYAGLLGSLHYSGFYTSHWGWQHWARPTELEPVLERFVAHELERQGRLRRELDMGSDDERRLSCNYFWLQLWDRISLDVCRFGFSGFAEDYPPVPVCYGGLPDAALPAGPEPVSCADPLRPGARRRGPGPGMARERRRDHRRDVRAPVTDLPRGCRGR